MTRKAWLWALIGGGIILLLFLASLFLGSVSLSYDQIASSLTGAGDELSNTIILQSRLPRALTAVSASVSLALSGLLMQTLFRNPLAGPSVLGISSGASLGVGVLLMASAAMGLGSVSPVLGALMGAFGVLILILFVSRRLRSATTLLIFGLMLGYVTSALLGILQYSATQEALRSFVIWGLGSFEAASMEDVLWIVSSTLIGVIFILNMLPSLDAMTLGERYAATMGVHVKKVRWLMIGLAGLLTGIATAFCGPIAFLGLATPHIARMIWRTERMRILVPATLITGAVIGLFCDIVCRLPFFEGAIPLNAVTCFVGVPVVLAIIWSGKFWRKSV